MTYEFEVSLVEFIKKHALREGDFTLSSGKKSNRFFDISKISLTAMGLRKIITAIQTKLHWYSNSWGFSRWDAIGGVALGGTPIVSALLLNGAEKAFFVRSEAKKDEVIEGTLEIGDKVLLIEDVVTTGESVLRAAKAIEAVGARVDMILCVLDREEGGEELLKAKGYNFHSLVKASFFDEKSNYNL